MIESVNIFLLPTSSKTWIGADREVFKAAAKTKEEIRMEQAGVKSGANRRSSCRSGYMVVGRSIKGTPKTLIGKKHVPKSCGV